MTSEAIAHGHETKHHALPAQVDADIIARELIATTTNESRRFKAIAWVLGIL